MAVIEASGLRRAFGATMALDGIDFRLEEGRILGLIGPNGAGKSTAINAILGLTPYKGQLRVLGCDPWAARDRLMRDVAFIADVAVSASLAAGLPSARLRSSRPPEVRPRRAPSNCSRAPP